MSNKICPSDTPNPYARPSDRDLQVMEGASKYIEKNTLSFRREGRDSYRVFIQDLPRYEYALRNLLSGNYGQAPAYRAWESLINPRVNHRATIGMMIARYESACPANFARQVYNELTEGERIELDGMIDRVCREAVSED